MPAMRTAPQKGRSGLQQISAWPKIAILLIHAIWSDQHLDRRKSRPRLTVVLLHQLLDIQAREHVVLLLRGVFLLRSVFLLRGLDCRRPRGSSAQVCWLKKANVNS